LAWLAERWRFHLIILKKTAVGPPLKNRERKKGKETDMLQKKTIILILLFSILTIIFLLINGGCSKHIPQETDEAKAFKILKAKKTDPKTGLAETLDPNLIKGEDREGYQIAKEIPEVLAQLPCFCGCEAVGHENLLDCFVDEHGVG
jgi:hypothetical protein